MVTVNYQLGVLGFLATPELSKDSGHADSGNHDLLDQIACLRWVQKNITAFGGDPGRLARRFRTYSSLNPQKGKSSMYSPTLPGLFSLLATSHSVLLRSCVLRGSSRFQLG